MWLFDSCVSKFNLLFCTKFLFISFSFSPTEKRELCLKRTQSFVRGSIWFKTSACLPWAQKWRQHQTATTFMLQVCTPVCVCCLIFRVVYKKIDLQHTYQCQWMIISTEPCRTISHRVVRSDHCMHSQVWRRKNVAFCSY